MNLEHIAKIGPFIFPVVKTNPDHSFLVESGNFKGRYIPHSKCLICTDAKGKIQSIKMG